MNRRKHNRRNKEVIWPGMKALGSRSEASEAPSTVKLGLTPKQVIGTRQQMNLSYVVITVFLLRIFSFLKD
jgi:hypothetical protein